MQFQHAELVPDLVELDVEALVLQCPSQPGTLLAVCGGPGLPVHSAAGCSTEGAQGGEVLQEGGVGSGELGGIGFGHGTVEHDCPSLRWIDGFHNRRRTAGCRH